MINKSHAALLSLSLCAFGIGTTELVTTGLLLNLSEDFNIPIEKAALVTSVYAFSVMLGGPAITAMTMKTPRKILLAGLMALFTLGSITSALASKFYILLIGRVFSGCCHGAFYGAGAVVASKLVSKEKEASAIALMFTGMTLANVIGVPAGTFIGQRYGWRTPFWGIAAIGALNIASLLKFVPQDIPVPTTNLTDEIHALKNPQIWLSLLATTTGFGGLLACFAYIGPLLTKISHFDKSDINWLLAIYGLGLVIGNTVAGKAADRSLIKTVYGSLIALTLTLATFIFTSQFQVSTIITLFFLGAVGFGTATPLQKLVMDKAKDAPTLVSAINTSAFNLGIGGGTLLSGWAISAGFGYTSPCWVGASLTAIGLTSAIASNSICLKKDNLQPSEPDPESPTTKLLSN